MNLLASGLVDFCRGLANQQQFHFSLSRNWKSVGKFDRILLVNIRSLKNRIAMFFQLCKQWLGIQQHGEFDILKYCKMEIAWSKNQSENCYVIQAPTPSTRVSTIDLTFQDLSSATIFRILNEVNLFSNDLLKTFTLLNPPILIPIILLQFSQIMQQGPRNNQLKMAIQFTKKLTTSSSEIPLKLFPPIFDCIFFPRRQMWHSRLTRNFLY
jgi:hypothetical protein